MRRVGEKCGKTPRRKVKTDTGLRVGRQRGGRPRQREKEGTGKGERRWAEKVLKP